MRFQLVSWLLFLQRMLNMSTNVRLYDREPTDGEHQWRLIVYVYTLNRKGDAAPVIL
jgi:hypothetical protein